MLLNARCRTATAEEVCLPLLIVNFPEAVDGPLCEKLGCWTTQALGLIQEAILRSKMLQN